MHGILNLLDKLQKQICRSVGPPFVAFLEPLAHCRNVASLDISCRYYFCKYSSEMAELVPRFYSRGKFTHFSDRCHDFSITIPRCYKDASVNRVIPREMRQNNKK